MCLFNISGAQYKSFVFSSHLGFFLESPDLGLLPIHSRGPGLTEFVQAMPSSLSLSLSSHVLALLSIPVDALIWVKKQYTSCSLDASCFAAYFLIGFQLLPPFSPPLSLPSVTLSPPLISAPPSLHHPFLFSEPEALSPSRAVSPHLSPPSSHQYPSISPSPRKQSDPSACCRLPASTLLCHLSLPLPLLWVNMTHASIILLSFCHYYAP